MGCMYDKTLLAKLNLIDITDNFTVRNNLLVKCQIGMSTLRSGLAYGANIMHS